MGRRFPKKKKDLLRKHDPKKDVQTWQEKIAHQRKKVGEDYIQAMLDGNLMIATTIWLTQPADVGLTRRDLEVLYEVFLRQNPGIEPKKGGTRIPEREKWRGHSKSYLATLKQRELNRASLVKSYIHAMLDGDLFKAFKIGLVEAVDHRLTAYDLENAYKVYLKTHPEAKPKLPAGKTKQDSKDE